MLVELLGMRAHVARVTHFGFVRPARLEALLAEPRVPGVLLRELGEEPEAGASEHDVIRQLRRRAIHLSLNPASPYCGLSIEEIVVVCAYQSASFRASAWKRSLTRVYSGETLASLASRWLTSTDAVLEPMLSRPGLVVARDKRLATVRAVAIAPDAEKLRRVLDGARGEAEFASQSFVMCSSCTALDFAGLGSSAATTGRYELLALEDELRARGAGLLLVDSGQVVVALDARHREYRARAELG